MSRVWTDHDLAPDGGRRRAWHYPTPAIPRLDDSDANIMRDLRHEGCGDHCAECGRCDWEPTGPETVRTVPMHHVDHGHSITTYCDDCHPNPDGYNPGPEMAVTHNDITLTVQRTHLHPDHAAHYWRLMVNGTHLPAADGTVIALDPTMSLRAVAARLCWELYATPTARLIGGDSPILIHHTPIAPTFDPARYPELHLIHQEGLAP